MATFEALARGFVLALTPAHLTWALFGATLGTAVGVLPGIGPALTVALLLPVTFNVEPTSAFIMFAGVYYGAMYGGSTTSILLNTPGETASIVSAIEGNVMARQGRGAAALATAAIGSFVAGTLATLALTVCAPVLVNVALRFGPAEYFALTLLAFVSVSAVMGSSRLRGMASLFFGLGLGLVGIDPQTGEARFAFGIPQLLDGVDVIILVIGLFAVGEIFYLVWTGDGDEEISPVRGSIWMTKDEWTRSWRPWLRGTLIGFPLGVLPIGGAEIPTFLSYLIEKRLSARRRSAEGGVRGPASARLGGVQGSPPFKDEEFGRGAIEGVAGPEAANNAAAAGVLVPLLTLGLPTSATAAVMLAAFQQYGLQPGPLLFSAQSDLVWALVASLYVGNLMLLVLNLPLVGVWVRLLLMPRPLLFGGILVLASLGSYSLNGSLFDLTLLYVVGITGCLMRLYEFPMAPAILGLILGPMAEQHFRRAISISQGDVTVFVTRPISGAIVAITLVLLVSPGIRHKVRDGTSQTPR